MRMVSRDPEVMLGPLSEWGGGHSPSRHAKEPGQDRSRVEEPVLGTQDRGPGATTPPWWGRTGQGWVAVNAHTTQICASLDMTYRYAEYATYICTTGHMGMWVTNDM